MLFFSPPSEDILSLPKPPGRTLVVGGTAEGVEYAGFLFGLGQAVTVMPQTDLLPGFDRRMAQRVENDLVVRGLEILHHCSVAEVLRMRLRLQMYFCKWNWKCGPQHALVPFCCRLRRLDHVRMILCQVN